MYTESEHHAVEVAVTAEQLLRFQDELERIAECAVGCASRLWSTRQEMVSSRCDGNDELTFPTNKLLALGEETHGCTLELEASMRKLKAHKRSIEELQSRTSAGALHHKQGDKLLLIATLLGALLAVREYVDNLDREIIGVLALR